ncbi:hypothetical protein [Campylobacter concisus]|nr:hypothetical protein [Campylobacter concisus]
MKKILLLSSDFEQNVILNASLYRFGFRMIQLKVRAQSSRTLSAATDKEI